MAGVPVRSTSRFGQRCSAGDVKLDARGSNSGGRMPREGDTGCMQIAYIGMGANLASPVGEPEATLAAAAERAGALGTVARRSSLYSTAPVGYAEQPRFVNAVIELETELSPQALLRELLRIEQEFGRDRSAGVENGPRTLDLDILLYADWVLHGADLDIPHPRLGERSFVLVPLHEIAPGAVEAGTQTSVKQLLEQLSTRSSSDTNAIFPIQSSFWCPDPLRDGDSAADGAIPLHSDG